MMMKKPILLVAVVLAGFVQASPSNAQCAPGPYYNACAQQLRQQQMERQRELQLQMQRQMLIQQQQRQLMLERQRMLQEQARQRQQQMERQREEAQRQQMLQEQARQRQQQAERQRQEAERQREVEQQRQRRKGQEAERHRNSPATSNNKPVASSRLRPVIPHPMRPTATEPSGTLRPGPTPSKGLPTMATTPQGGEHRPIGGGPGRHPPTRPTGGHGSSGTVAGPSHAPTRTGSFRPLPSPAGSLGAGAVAGAIGGLAGSRGGGSADNSPGNPAAGAFAPLPDNGARDLGMDAGAAPNTGYYGALPGDALDPGPTLATSDLGQPLSTDLNSSDGGLPPLPLSDADQTLAPPTYQALTPPADQALTPPTDETPTPPTADTSTTPGTAPAPEAGDTLTPPRERLEPPKQPKQALASPKAPERAKQETGTAEIPPRVQLASAPLDKAISQLRRGDYDGAYRSLKPLAEHDPEAQFLLATLYESGKGAKRDYAKAAGLLKKAARQQNAKAAYILGIMYIRGLGVPKDAKAGARWHLKSAKEGEPLAQNAVGLEYAEGFGLDKDPAEAAKWTYRAAQQGVIPAQVRVAKILTEGTGVPKDTVAAYSWAKIVTLEAARGEIPNSGGSWSNEALKILHDCKAGMTSDDVTQAEKLAHEWKAKRAEPASTRSSAAAEHRLGPSFGCAQHSEPLAQMICASRELSELDLRYNQAFRALLWQARQSGRAALWQESSNFQEAVLHDCGVPAEGPVSGSAACVAEHYQQQRSVWLSRLAEPAREEAQRPLAQHVALQADLQTLRYLPADGRIDGLYGYKTRVAIAAWQSASGRTPTGFLDDEDARTLARASAQNPAVAAAKSGN